MSSLVQEVLHVDSVNGLWCDCSTRTLLQVSLPHDGQTGLGVLRRRLRPRSTGRYARVARLRVVLGLRPLLRYGDDPLLPACIRLSVRLLLGGHRRVAVTASVGGGVRDRGRSLAVVRHFDVTGAAPVRVLDFGPDAAVHHADQVCGLHRDAGGQSLEICTNLVIFFFLCALKAVQNFLQLQSFGCLDCKLQSKWKLLLKKSLKSCV